MMKSRLIGCLVIALVFLSGCDPVYPTGKIRVESISILHVGDEVEIKPVYPTGGIGVVGWKNQTVKIIDNLNVISVDGLMITAVGNGTATIKVSATTILAQGAYDDGLSEKVYSSATIKIIVK